MRIVVLSPRVAPGILTLEAWDVLRAAASVRAAEDDPHVRAIVSSGIDVEVSPSPPAYAEDTVWIAPTGDTGWAHTIAADLMGGAGADVDVEVIFGSYDLPGAALLDVVDVLDRLRRECPWTAQQTHGSLSHYLLEEAHETLEALDSGDSEHLREELGDLLMQIVFHARIASEGEESWDIDDVAAGIAAKLIYRNPHVFGDAEVTSAEEVDANWQRLKASEKGRASVLDGIPASLPALAYADKVLGRIDQVDVLGDDLGSRLLRLVQEARARGEDSEEALRRAVRGLG